VLPKKQLTIPEQMLLDKMLRQEGASVNDAWKRLSADRLAKKIQPLHISNVYRFASGLTHKRCSIETRGRKRALSASDVRTLDKTRRKLIRAANSEDPVTYEDIAKESGIGEKASLRTHAQALRDLGVRFRSPREKVCITAEDAKQRLRTAKVWSSFPTGYWLKKVHAYVDNKSFPMPLTAAQRAKYKKTRVTGHLRKPSEGVERGFTKPRMRHSFLGVPSVNISAAVAKDRVIMWYAHTRPWNGETAAAMYKGPLLKSMTRTWGNRRTFTIVEDGDRKGNQSSKGIAAKAEVRIRAMTLPPRTPEWMPLDFAIWKAIEDRMLQCEPDRKETREQYLARLRKCALGLPRTFVRKVIGRMRTNIKEVKDAKGYHGKTS
jgi:biotin operon repressor